jgi:hypothetical protein
MLKKSGWNGMNRNREEENELASMIMRSSQERKSC